MVDVNKIIDIEDLCGKKRIDETFNVINYIEIRQYGEYRTKRLVIEVLYKFDMVDKL